MNPTKLTSRLGAAIFLFGSLFISGAGCVSDSKVISQAAEVHQGLEPAVINDPTLSTYIQQVGDRIVKVAQELDKQDFGPASHKKDQDTSWMYQDMQFHLVNSKTLNAFTTGGKHMYIYTELFETCKNEDELAAVMSHEYAHVYCRHVAQGMNRQYGQLAAAGAVGAAGAAVGYSQNKTEGALQYGQYAFAAGQAAGQYIGMGFTRDDENEADKYGFWFYSHAGWNPQRFAGFFQTMIDKGYDKTPEALSDHPKLSNRVASTKERIGQLPKDADSWRRAPVANDSKFKDLQARAAKLSKSLPDDASLQKAQLMLAAFPSCVSPVEQPDQKQAQAVIYQAMNNPQQKKQK